MTSGTSGASSLPPWVAKLVQQVNSEVGSKSGSTTSGNSLYGLGEWANQKINPGDLPFLTDIIESGQHTTGNAIVEAFAKAGQSDPGTVATIQRALLLGGYYDKTYTPTYGVIKPQDITAFGNAVTVAGQSQAPVSQVLLQGAQYGTTAGVAAARAGTQAAKVARISLPSTSDLEDVAIAEFQKVLGRKATPAEEAAFAASYRAYASGIERANNQAVYDAETGAGSGLTGGQTRKLEAQAAGAGLPSQQDIANYNATVDPNTGNAQLNERIRNLQENQGVPALQPPSFTQEMNTLGGIAQQAQQEANPTSAASSTGLTQLTENSPESPTVAAENYARNVDPHGAAGNDLANTFDSFLSIISQKFA